MSVGRPAIIHGDDEETGRPVGLALRFHFLQMPAERFLAFIKAEDRLKFRSFARRPFEPGVKRDRVERLVSEPAFEGHLEQPPALQRVELMDFPLHQTPFVLAHHQQLIDRPAEDLRELEQSECLLDRAGLVAGQFFSPGFTTITRRQGTIIGLEILPEGAAVEQQPHGQKLVERPGKDRQGDAVRPGFDLLDHPRPAPQGQERFLDVFAAFVPADAQEIQRFLDQFQLVLAAVANRPALPGHRAKPAIGRSAGTSVKLAKR